MLIFERLAYLDGRFALGRFLNASRSFWFGLGRTLGFYLDAWLCVLLRTLGTLGFLGRTLGTLGFWDASLWDAWDAWVFGRTLRFGTLGTRRFFKKGRFALALNGRLGRFAFGTLRF